jgi:hypothetical protein
MRCVRGDGEYSWGLKVCKRFFIRYLRIYYKGIRSIMSEVRCFEVVMLHSGVVFWE